MTFKQLLLFVFIIHLTVLSKAGNTFSLDSSAKSRTSFSLKCEKTDSVNLIISEAINVGAPTYNQGNPLGCYRIYEGASYKILYYYGSSCTRVSQILKTALEKSYGLFSDSDKAWIMRAAFDEILGEPTRTK
jgi:hypothetical protein